MEELMGFKFSLDLSDFDKAEDRINEALDEIVKHAREQGDNVDVAMGDYLNTMMQQREDSLRKLQERFEKAAIENASSWANYIKGEGSREEWKEAEKNYNDLSDAIKQVEKEMTVLQEKQDEVAGNMSFRDRLKVDLKQMDMYGKAMSMLPEPIANVVKSTGFLDKALKGLLANPVVLTIGAIILVLKQLTGYFDWMAERFEPIAYAWGLVTEAARKFMETLKAIISLDWESLKYNFLTMFDGGEREIQKRNQKVLDAKRDQEQKLNDIENHWLRRRMNNTALSYQERLAADKKFSENRIQNQKLELDKLNDQYKIWLDTAAMYDEKLNPRGTKTDASQLSKDEEAEYTKWQTKIKQALARIEMEEAESADRRARILEQQKRAWDSNMKWLDDYQQKHAKKMADYHRSVREQLEQENRRLAKLGQQNENRILQSQIEDMADGIEKAAKQAELKSKQSIEALDDTLYNEAQRLWSNQKKIFDSNPANEGKSFGVFDNNAFNKYKSQAMENIDYEGQLDDIAKKEEKTVQKSIDSQLTQYKTFAEKRLEIDRQAQETRLALEKKGLQNSEQAQLAELDRIKKQFDLNLEEYANGGFVKTAMANMTDLSKESLDMLQKELDEFTTKTFLEGLASDETIAQLDALQERIDQAKEPYKSLSDAITDVKLAQQQLNEARKKGDPTKIAEAEGKLARATENVKNKYDDTMAAISGCADAIADLGSQIGGVVGGIMQLMPNVLSVVSGVGNAMKVLTTKTVAQLKAIETASIILEIISLVVQLGEAIASLFQSKKEEERQAKEYQEKMVNAYAQITDAVHAYKQAMIDAKYAQEGLWANTNIGAMQKNLEKLKDSEVAYYQTLNDVYARKVVKNSVYDSNLMNQLSQTGATITKTGVGSQGVYANMVTDNWYDSLQVGYQNASNQGNLLRYALESRGMKQLFTDTLEFDVEAYKALKNEASDLWNMLDESARNDFTRLANYAEEYQKLLDELADEMVSWYSPLLDNMADAWMDWLDGAENTMDKFKEYSSDTFRDILKDLLKYELYEKVFAQFKDKASELTANYASGGMTSEQFAKQLATETEGLMGEMETNSKIFKELIENVDKEFEAIGINLSNTADATSESASARGIARASQESVDENNARLAMMQKHTYTINANVSQLVQMSSTALTHLAAISNNTAHLASIDKRLDDITTYGIKTR